MRKINNGKSNKNRTKKPSGINKNSGKWVVKQVGSPKPPNKPVILPPPKKDK